MTISDSRTAADDKSGAMLKRLTTEAGHQIHEQCIVRDDIYQIRAAVSRWIADPAVQAVITTGGTGITGRDGTPEAVRPLLDKVIDGFGEMFRVISYELIGTSTMQSRARGRGGQRHLCVLPARLVRRLQGRLDQADLASAGLPDAAM